MKMLRLAGGQQLLAGELGRGVQIERATAAVRADQLGGKGVQVRLVAGRDLQDGGIDLDEALAVEPAPQRRLNCAARQQERPPVGMDVRMPPGASRGAIGGRRWHARSCSLALPEKACRKRPTDLTSLPPTGAHAALASPQDAAEVGRW